MKKSIFLTILIASITAVQFFIQAQNYKFQKYGVEKGICHPFVYNVNQDKNGYIWASTGTGLCRFDGFTFLHNGNSKDSLPESFAPVIFKDKDKSLWFGYSDGNIVKYDGKKFLLIKPEESQTGSINDVINTPKGQILAANQSAGLILIDKDLKKTLFKEMFLGKLIYSLAFGTSTQLLVGTDNGVEIYLFDESRGSCKYVKALEGFPMTKVNQITPSVEKESFWVATEDAGLLLIRNAGNHLFKVENFGSALHLETDNIQSVFQDGEHNLWISTKEKGLFKVALGNNMEIKGFVNYNSQNGLGLDFVKQAFQDTEGNIWVATYGNGLSNLLSESFVSYNYNNVFKDNNILSVCYDKDGYWVGGDKGIVRVKTGINPSSVILNSANGLPSDGITALFVDKNNTLWVGTNKSGVYQILSGTNRAKSFLRSDNSLTNSINHINGKDNNVFVGTKNGVYQYNLATGQQTHLSTTEGLPYNNIRQIFIDNKGTPWVATRSKTPFPLVDNEQHRINGKVELDFTSITQDAEGDIWAGTNGTGVFQFTKDTFYCFTIREGLKSDFCYSLTRDNYGNIWVGHRLGLSRINSKTHQIKTFGNECLTGDINFNATSVNVDGNILFGTTDGLIMYESSKVRKKVSAPMLNIASVIINDKSYDIDEKIVLPYAKYRMRIEFIGLNYSNPDQVTYQYKMDGYDSQWTELSQNNTAIISNLADGNYTFMLKACNGDGVCTETPLTFSLKISKPFWKTWWFISFSIVLVISSVYFIIVYRERKQKQFQIYLERLLDERTKEVREQKEVIEIKNRDITDSINYAQRIQASILPSIKKLQNYFSGSFVYYAPRDIVSGDFYWFEIIPNTSKFLIVCADSTGHGVPGAFMSIIGTTLLKDVFTRPDISKPSDILMHLDNELKTTLNQNVDGERPSDGMDIIVCEIDIKTNIARFASAMRPFIVYQNGEQLFFKGSRNSIGGRTIEEKVFEDIELQLSKGDLVYMFSDGYPDQFGGPIAKKFKMVRLRNLMKDIYQKPMDEQYTYVKSNFDLWRGELPQVDDVLFMGIKI